MLLPEVEAKLKKIVESDTFSPTKAKQILVEAGYDTETVDNLIEKLTKENEIFSEKERKATDYFISAAAVTIFCATMPKLMGITSFLWYAVYAVAACITSYFLVRARFAGVVASLVAVFVGKFFTEFYFSGTKREIDEVDMFIPALFVIVPSGLLYYILASIFYPKE